MMISSNIDSGFSNSEFRNDYLDKVRELNQTEIKNNEGTSEDRLQTPRTSNLQVVAALNNGRADGKESKDPTEADPKGRFVDSVL